ncbi:NADH-quinone oxidoreductase subunit C [bacterium]|nr:NADH-quinone oxidoreductase subunit C [bacterium]
MNNLNILQEKFNSVQITDSNKIIVHDNLVSVLEFLKNTSEFDFDMLTTIIATDKIERIELIYQLYSTGNNNTLNVYYYAPGAAPTVIGLYKSAYFDECEIYDLLGVKFEGNKELKRLLLPDSWIGHPLLKNYTNNDERLAWND